MTQGRYTSLIPGLEPDRKAAPTPSAAPAPIYICICGYTGPHPFPPCPGCDLPMCSQCLYSDERVRPGLCGICAGDDRTRTWWGGRPLAGEPLTTPALDTLWTACRGPVEEVARATQGVLNADGACIADRTFTGSCLIYPARLAAEHLFAPAWERQQAALQAYRDAFREAQGAQP